MAETEILLESGTNEMEIMEFMIYEESYGINVAKVTEIMMSSAVKPIPHAHACIEGIFKPRDTVLTVVDLPKYLTGKETTRNEKDLFIVTNFNKLHIAFRVQSVVGIQRISWKDIQKPDKTLNYGEEGVATGIAQCNGQLITILDFEKIVTEIAPETGIQVSEIESMGEREQKNAHIVLAEDSALLAAMIKDSLVKAGYSNLTKFNNGQEAWNYIRKFKDREDPREEIDLIITDIEMPEMDGHRLTKLVKDDTKLKKIPLIIFSSLINEEMETKGRQLGADGQLSKPEIGRLVSVIDQLLEEGQR